MSQDTNRSPIRLGSGMSIPFSDLPLIRSGNSSSNSNPFLPDFQDVHTLPSIPGAGELPSIPSDNAHSGSNAYIPEYRDFQDVNNQRFVPGGNSDPQSPFYQPNDPSDPQSPGYQPNSPSLPIARPAGKRPPAGNKRPAGKRPPPPAISDEHWSFSDLNQEQDPDSGDEIHDPDTAARLHQDELSEMHRVLSEHRDLPDRLPLHRYGLTVDDTTKLYDPAAPLSRIRTRTLTLHDKVHRFRAGRYLNRNLVLPSDLTPNSYYRVDALAKNKKYRNRWVQGDWNQVGRDGAPRSRGTARSSIATKKSTPSSSMAPGARMPGIQQRNSGS